LKEGIEDTETTESFDEESSARIIREVVRRRNCLSVNEIIKISNEMEDTEPLTKNQIYHHLPEMIKAGLVELYGVLQRGKRTTDFYRRTADNFVTFGLHYEPEKYRKAVKEETEKALSLFNLSLSEKNRKKFLELAVKSEIMKLEGADAVESLVNEDITEDKAVELLEWFLWVYALGNEEYLKVIQQVREIIFKDK
jgi:hypothetical protein